MWNLTKMLYLHSQKYFIMIRYISIFTLILSLLTGCQDTQNNQTVVEKEVSSQPKNIILLIGDGMGLSQVSSRYYFGEGEPNFNRFNNIGIINTSSSRQKITDSASGATAFSAGKRTYNGAIGVDDDTVAIETILEKVSKTGLSTGVISTSSVTHATPASFYAHVDSRGKQEEIASFAPESGVNFLAGGGIKWFNKRKDGRNILDELAKLEYVVDTTALPATVDPSKNYVSLLAPDGMPRMLDGRGDFLPKATKKALEHLSANEKGFFLMVEGSQIDWGGHANNAEYIHTEVQDFDNAIGAAMDFAEKDGNTLVIVTADHETGGYTLRSGENYNDIAPGFSTGGHSATLVPVFAFGPGSDKFRGIYQNNNIYDKMMDASKW